MDNDLKITLDLVQKLSLQNNVKSIDLSWTAEEVNHEVLVFPELKIEFKDQ